MALPLSQKSPALLENAPKPTPLTQQAREAPRNPLGEIQSPDLILRTSHHRKEEKITKLSTFQLAIPLHHGGTGQGPVVGGSAAIFTLIFPELPTNPGYRTPQ